MFVFNFPHKLINRFPHGTTQIHLHGKYASVIIAYTSCADTNLNLTPPTDAVMVLSELL